MSGNLISIQTLSLVTAISPLGQYKISVGPPNYRDKVSAISNCLKWHSHANLNDACGRMIMIIHYDHCHSPDGHLPLVWFSSLLNQPIYHNCCSLQQFQILLFSSLLNFPIPLPTAPSSSFFTIFKRRWYVLAGWPLLPAYYSRAAIFPPQRR